MKTFNIDEYINKQQYLLKKIKDEKVRDIFLKENCLITSILDKCDEEYLSIILPIITNQEFIKTRSHLHHDNISTFTHMLHVSIEAYNIAKKQKLNISNATIAGLLHDFYQYDWHKTNQKEKGIFNMHAFSHALHAKKNVKKVFPNLTNDTIENAIMAHSWHLYILKKIFHPCKFKLKDHLPHSKEAFAVFRADIKASMYSAKNPIMIYNSLGFNKHYNGIQYWVLKNRYLILIFSMFR